MFPLTPFSSGWAGRAALSVAVAAVFHVSVASAQDVAPAPEAAATEPAAVPEAAAPAVAPEAAPTPSPEVLKARESLGRFATLFSQRRFARAAEALKEAEAVMPDAPEVISSRAALLAETGQIAEARVIYQKLVDQAPDSFVPQFNLAELLAMERRYADAKAAFEALLVKFPESEFVKFKLILMSLALKDQKEALEWRKKLKADQPTALLFYSEAAIALANGEMAKGRLLIEEADQQFGEGQWQLLHESLAQIGLVLRSDYPPRPAER